MKKTIIVMPVANEEETMKNLLDEIMSLGYDNLYVYPVVDDFSRDNTKGIIEDYSKTNDKVKCIYFKEKHSGVATCYLYGFKKALDDGAEYIIEMDGGYSHNPKEIKGFIEGLDEGYDCVFGSRFVKGGDISSHPLYRRLLSSGGTILSNLVLGTKLKDMTSGFEAFRREVLDNMNLDRVLSKGHMYQTEMRYYMRNYKSKEVPIHYIGGGSTLKPKAVIEALKILFMLKGNEKEVKKNG